MIDLGGRVALVTGAGGGLGRAHARLLARRGVRVAVNDVELDDARSNAHAVVEEIRQAGGDAIAVVGSVTDPSAVERMVRDIVRSWDRIDILVNNAGILRDKSFAKMGLDDFRAVLDVHVTGAFVCTKAVWETMKSRNFGRIVMTTSSSGLFGNFGQANYAAAKMALVGLMQALAIEGAKNNIRVNCLSPTAGTRMLEGLMPADRLAQLNPDAVSPGLLALVSEDAPTRAILCAGAGVFARSHITLTQGVYLGLGDDVAEKVAHSWEAISGREGDLVPDSGADQWRKELAKAGFSAQD